VLVAANLTATVTRYVAMRMWVFAHASSSPPPSSPAALSVRRLGESDEPRL
jgi:hypothetical protein